MFFSGTFDSLDPSFKPSILPRYNNYAQESDKCPKRSRLDGKPLAIIASLYIYIYSWLILLWEGKSERTTSREYKIKQIVINQSNVRLELSFTHTFGAILQHFCLIVARWLIRLSRPACGGQRTQWETPWDEIYLYPRTASSHKQTHTYCSPNITVSKNTDASRWGPLIQPC